MSAAPKDRRPGRTGRPGPARRPAFDPARRVAYDVLTAVTERDAYANLLLPALLRERRLAGRDAALATELTYGTLRGRGSYDAVLAACVDRPLEAVDPEVLDLLRLGAHQLLATRVPPHAAVSVTVDLARVALGGGRAGFVNAVLRRVAARDLAGWLAVVAPDERADPLGHLAVVHSHPRWIVAAFAEALGADLSATAAALAADQDRPRVSLVAWPGRSEVAELRAAGAGPGRFSPYAAVLPEGDPAGVGPVRSGRAGVQDEGSQLVALALARAGLDGKDRAWLDLCAGPGGKAALLAGLAGQRGARLVAAEVAPHRAGLVAEALSGESAGAAVVADARVPAWPSGVFDRVLVDAPCTGLGALRRRPEARWRRFPADLPALTAVQGDLLAAGVNAARPGGVIAYVTCSPHLAETRVVVGDLLKGHPGVRQLDARQFLPEVPDLGGGPHVQLWPHVHGTDAMFLALLRRL